MKAALLPQPGRGDGGLVSCPMAAAPSLPFCIDNLQSNHIRGAEPSRRDVHTGRAVYVKPITVREHITVCCNGPRKSKGVEEIRPGRHPFSGNYLCCVKEIGGRKYHVSYLSGIGSNSLSVKGDWLLIKD